ncbi:MAG: hypothetical protein WCL51_17500, partial [Bacteroidota bacterium]
MWSENFKEHIRKEKIKQKDIYPLMGISKETFILNMKKNSMNIEHLLKVYEHYNWDLNELKEEQLDIVNQSPLKQQNTTKSDIYSTFELKEIKNLYEKLLEGKDKEINYLRKQLDKLIKNSSALEE